MEASSESSVWKEISDITECSICKEPFKEPKMLPCIHTFCLHCLETYSKGQDPLEKSTCPLCRKELTIPSGGFKDLPSNFFMNQLLQLNQLSNLTISKTTSKIFCEVCPDEKANAYCIECGQYLCNVCASRHRNHKLFKDHQVVSVNQMPSDEELLKMAPSYCQKHPQDEIKIYCYDCKMIICTVCYMDNSHNMHECSDIKKSGEKFRKQLQKDIENVNACSLAIDQQLKQLKKERRKLADRVKSVKGEISMKYEDTKALLDSQKEKLLADLDAFEKKKMKEFEIRKNEVKMQFGIMENFNRYCQEMKDKGRPCAVSSSADDLHRRANELVKTTKENMTTPVASVDVKFTPSSTTDTLIGQLAFSGERNDGNVSTAICVTSFLQSMTKVLHEVKCTPYLSSVTLVGGELFVCSESEPLVTVYDTQSYRVTRRLDIPGSSISYALTGCPHNICLYVITGSPSIPGTSVVRFDISSNSTMSWSLAGPCYGLSVTREHNLLVALYSDKKVQEYTTRGLLLREISLDASIDNMMHCIELYTGMFVVCHRGAKQHRVCIVNVNGKIIYSFGGEKGSGVNQLNCPGRMSVDSLNHVFVADRFNDRVQLLSPALTILGTVQIPGRKLNRPNAVHLDEINNRLHIGEYGSGHVLVLQVQIENNEF